MAEGETAVALRMALLSGLSRLLGPLRYRVADVIGLVRHRRQDVERTFAVSAHLRRDPDAGLRVARRRARRSFCEYVRMEADFLCATTEPAARLLHRCTIDGDESLERARRGNAVLVLCHVGDWDRAASLGAVLGLHVSSVMAAVGSPAMTAWVARNRHRFGLVLHEPGAAARALLRALRDGRCVGVMCDIPEYGPTVEVTYCGGPVRFSAVPARLARRTGAAIIPVDCVRRPRGHRLRLHPPIPVEEGEDDTVVTQRIADVFSAAVAEVPEQWYPFHAVYADRAPSDDGTEAPEGA